MYPRHCFHLSVFNTVQETRCHTVSKIKWPKAHKLLYTIFLINPVSSKDQGVAPKIKPNHGADIDVVRDVPLVYYTASSQYWDYGLNHGHDHSLHDCHLP